MRNPKKQLEELTSVIAEDEKRHGLIGLGDFDKLVAQISGPMSAMNTALIVDPSNPKRSLGYMPKQSMVLALLYLGKIDSNDPDKYYVFIPIDELRMVFGRDRELKKNELMRWITYLQAPCRLKGESQYRTVNFFAEGEIKYSETGKMIGIQLCCSPYSKEFIYNLSENDQKYIKIVVSWIIRFKSIYSFRLLYRIADEYFCVWGTENGNKCDWDVSVEELRDDVLMAPGSYGWNALNNNILKDSFREINSYTGYKLSLKKGSYSHIENITVTIEKKYDPKTIVEEVENKYPDIDSFKNYKEYISFYNGLSSDRRAEYDAVLQTRNANTHGVLSTINVLKECLRLKYTKNQYAYLARCINRNLRQENDRHYDDAEYEHLTLFDYIDVLQGFEEKAATNSRKEHEYSEQNYVIACFESYLGI